jgi:hypothetical protein
MIKGFIVFFKKLENHFLITFLFYEIKKKHKT